MDYILLVALVLFVIASYLAIHFNSRLSALQKDYKLKEEFLQYANKEADQAKAESLEQQHRADVFQKIISDLEEKHNSFIELQKKQLIAEFELQAKAIRAEIGRAHV